MLNILSNTETAADPCAGSVPGAVLPGYVGTVEPGGTGALVRPRPRAGQQFGPQISCEKYAHMTRIAAASGGASGPHPARDPV
jgi:hypothetical protein